MTDLVFLLLIFFLMTSRLAPPDPFEVTPPQAETADDGRVAP
ncbi:MAG: biopolymer transporter ExbD, partial [Flavobacteriales bacterium]